MPTRNYNTVTILPYLYLNGEIGFDNLRIWPFHKYKDKNISDTALKTHLEKILQTYTYVSGRSIENPTIITNYRYEFPNIYKKTIDKIEYTKQALLIPSILKMNSWNFITSDNFLSYYQRFQIGNTGISTQAGAIHGISTGGYTMDEIQFQKPEYIHVANQPVNFDIPTLSALLDLYKDRETNLDKANIYNSLGPFFYTYKNTTEIPMHTRILNLIMAFELLFGESSRSNFRSNILNYVSRDPSSEQKYSYPEVHTQTGAVIRNLNLSLPEIWAEEFYKLRHRIIHGNVVSTTDFVFNDTEDITTKNDPHFYIAINMFVGCVLKKLRDLGYQDIPKYYISTADIPIYKNISGISDELFKIEDRGLHEILAGM
ncbi:hypothetical protein GF360_01595 [candidate division WWE3 bacterium]|nr:hypothetical protein [candidate division WWE3 bacterium]